MGAGSFPRVNRLGLRADHPPPSSTHIKERVELYIYFVACFRSNFDFYFHVENVLHTSLSHRRVGL
jgi:hypothetical protein